MWLVSWAASLQPAAAATTSAAFGPSSPPRASRMSACTRGCALPPHCSLLLPHLAAHAAANVSADASTAGLQQGLLALGKASAAKKSSSIVPTQRTSGVLSTRLWSTQRMWSSRASSVTAPCATSSVESNATPPCTSNSRFAAIRRSCCVGAPRNSSSSQTSFEATSGLESGDQSKGRKPGNLHKPVSGGGAGKTTASGGGRAN
mmetsp:Transcript_61938/g.157496  ORF Transcript_61938/g.157496 Transcript_61938/m.157496 type:complete len:204 (+) Transcript_61938:1156-1767(+)